MTIKNPGMPWVLLESRDWLDGWFMAHGKKEIAEDLFENVDSFGVIELIMDIEKHFGIRFTERDWQNRKLPTITGLAEIIREKQNV